MIKRTLFFGNPVYLSTKNEQLIIRLPEVEKNDTIPDHFKKEAQATIPIEDIGVVILEHKQIVISHALIQKLVDNNVAVITCDEQHHPSALLMPLCTNTIQAERFRHQTSVSEPLRKQLWQQTIMMKIINQAKHLHERGIDTKNMLHWSNSVKSGDTENHEARAAAYYWSKLFPESMNFRRDRDGESPNNLLNYGYAILRAVVARSLVASGLLPTFGIHHCNRYNAYALADDIMEPYRPFVDKIVLGMVHEEKHTRTMNTEHKKELLIIPAMDVRIDGECSPLMIAVGRTTASLAKCYSGEQRKILYPEYE